MGDTDVPGLRLPGSLVFSSRLQTAGKLSNTSVSSAEDPLHLLSQHTREEGDLSTKDP